MKSIREFFVSVRNAELEVIERSLAEDPALARARDEAGISAICTAVYFGRDDVARLIARDRDDLDIFEASTLGDANRIRELISSAPELVNAYSPDGFQPLGYACFFGRRAVFELLLEAGADLEAPARNPMQVRPLHSAVAQSDPETALVLAHKLLAAGASPNVRQQGATRLSMKRRSGDTKTLSAYCSNKATMQRLPMQRGGSPPTSPAKAARRMSLSSWSLPANKLLPCLWLGDRPSVNRFIGAALPRADPCAIAAPRCNRVRRHEADGTGREGPARGGSHDSSRRES